MGGVDLIQLFLLKGCITLHKYSTKTNDAFYIISSNFHGQDKSCTNIVKIAITDTLVACKADAGGASTEKALAKCNAGNAEHKQTLCEDICPICL